MLPEDSNASLNKSLVPASKLIGLYIGSTRLEFPEDGTGTAPVRVYFYHDSLMSLYEVNIILVQISITILFSRAMMSILPVLLGTILIFHGKYESKLTQEGRLSHFLGMIQDATTTLMTVTSPILCVTVGI